MTTFVQLHLLTAYPPSNLNRDDTGKPKTARFGNVERMRVSSQALKRAWRTSDAFKTALAGHLGERTQRLGEAIERHLLGRGVEAAAARAAARAVGDVFGKMKAATDRNPTRIEQLAFVSADERAAAFAAAERIAAGEMVDFAKTPLLKAVDGAVDIAMFGRMLADDPDFNREAAVQVAHAITTHRALVEDDYYTAVDDLKGPSEDAGAGFVGEAGFGAPLLYLYLCIDRDLLVRNLAGDEGLARRGIAALVQAAATVGPRGKQASFATRALASYALVEVGDHAPHTLAAAFLKPVGGESALEASVQAFERARDQFRHAYDQPASPRDRDPEGWRGGDDSWPVMNVLTGEGSLRRLVAYAAR